MDHKLDDIKGLDDANRAKLSALGIADVHHLLAHAPTPKRNALAKQLGVSSSQVTEWINRADLMRLKGVGREMANLLEECGVDSCKELQHRTPANLQAKLKETNDAKKITHHAPTVAQVETWVTEAKQWVAKDAAQAST